MQMPLGYASIPAPSLLEFHICRHFTKSLIWIEMQMPLGHILRINLQDLIGTSIVLLYQLSPAFPFWQCLIGKAKHPVRSHNRMIKVQRFESPVKMQKHISFSHLRQAFHILR